VARVSPPLGTGVSPRPKTRTVRYRCPVRGERPNGHNPRNLEVEHPVPGKDRDSSSVFPARPELTMETPQDQEPQEDDHHNDKPKNPEGGHEDRGVTHVNAINSDRPATPQVSTNPR